MQKLYIQVMDFYLKMQIWTKILEENKIKFIGASSKHIEMMGDKIQAKKIAYKWFTCYRRI